MPTLAEALAVLSEHKDPNDVAGQLRTAAPKVYQIAFDAGHSTATAAKNTDIKRLEKEVETATAAKTGAEEKLAEIQKGQPDVAKLRADHDAVLADLKEKHKQELQTLKDAARDREKKAALKDLELALVAAGVDPEYAAIKVQQQEIAGRIEIADDGSRTIRQLDKDTPYSGKDAVENVKLLAADVRKGITNPKFITATADGGSGTTGGSGGGQGDRAVFDEMRKLGRELSNPHAAPPATGGNKEPAQPARAPGLEERMNMARRT